MKAYWFDDTEIELPTWLVALGIAALIASACFS